MLNIGGLATKVELKAVDEKIPNITGLISKSDHDKDINEIKNNYVLASKLRENEPEKNSPLNRYFLGKSYFGDDGNQN